MSCTRLAEQAARTEGEFVSMAAHELSQPLQTLELAWSAVQRHAPSDAEFGELTQLATTSLSRMRELVRKLLDISRVESGSVRVEEECTSVRQICEDLERRFAPVANKKGLAFRCRPCPAAIETDPILLHGILSNLVTNAIRYTSQGEVLIECRFAPDHGLDLAVHDTGIGIPARELKNVFRDFYRSEEAQEMAPEGVGLGLGVVQRLSKLLVLPVTVHSKPGIGSTFIVHVPARKVASADRHSVVLREQAVARA
jgi:two-component system, sensor histidine kinase